MDYRVQRLGMKALQPANKDDIPRLLHCRLLDLIGLSNALRSDLEIISSNASEMLLEVNLSADQINVERLDRDFKLSDVMLRRVQKNSKAYISEAYFLIDILAAPLECLYEE